MCIYIYIYYFFFFKSGVALNPLKCTLSCPSVKLCVPLIVPELKPHLRGVCVLMSGNLRSVFFLTEWVEFIL